MTTFRKSWPDELERADRICPSRPGFKQCFLAVEDAPVERIVGAAFWSVLETPTPTAGAENPECLVEFDWRMLPRYVGSETERAFLTALKGDVRIRSDATILKTCRIFPPGSHPIRALEAAGFREHSTNIIFEGSLAGAREGYARMQRTFGQADTSALAVAAPDLSHAEALKRLICQREGLLSISDIDRPLANPFSENRAFDPEWSTVLLEVPSQRVIGAELMRVCDEVMTVPVLVIDAGAPYLPGLGWFLILRRWLELCEKHGWGRDFFYRVNPRTNPTMHKMAALFGYREIERQHSYAIDLDRRDSNPPRF